VPVPRKLFLRDARPCAVSRRRQNGVVAERPAHPVRLVVHDDLERSRLTVLLRLVLALPHLFWLTLYATAALVLGFVAWLFVIVTGRVPKSLHRFLANYTRYSTHLTAYLCLAANPYPGFSGDGDYPVDVEIGPPVSQRRLGAAVRLVVAIPALVLSLALAGSAVLAVVAAVGTGGLVVTIALLAWFSCLARGRMPRGMRDAAAYSIGYGAQTTAYVLLVTDRYPDSTPGLADPAPELPPHPVTMVADDDLRRPRLLVLFRALLCIPHLLWLLAWTALAAAAWLLAWLAALVVGRVPLPLHRFLAAYVRAWTHLLCFLHLVARPFPGFVGRQGGYPVDLRIEPPAHQGRLGVLFRLLLVLPALVLASAYAGVVLVVAVLGWFAALAVGRMPAGLRDLGAAALRYQGQVNAYLFLLTSRYPYSSPALTGPAAPEPVQLAEEGLG
jgi:Domain of unknown function (DUF4389)